MPASGGGGADGEKLVTLDFGRYAHRAVCANFYAHDFTEAANINLPRLGNFLRKGEYEIDLAADFKFRFREKIEAAITNIASIGVEGFAVRFARKNAHGQAHRKAPRFAAINSIRHQDLSACNRSDANTRFCKPQSERLTIMS